MKIEERREYSPEGIVEIIRRVDKLDSKLRYAYDTLSNLRKSEAENKLEEISGSIIVFVEGALEDLIYAHDLYLELSENIRKCIEKDYRSQFVYNEIRGFCAPRTYAGRAELGATMRLEARIKELKEIAGRK